MTAEPRLLLDASITYLQRLAHVFAEQIGNANESDEGPIPDTRVCKELLLSISVLLPKLQAARYFIGEEDVPAGRCRSCEDD